MARPLSFVRLDIARFGLEISDRPNSDDLAKWARSLYRSLALQDPSLNEFGACLLLESENFRKADSERKKRSFQRNPPDSASAIVNPLTDQIRSDQIKPDQIKEKKKEPLPRFQPPTLQEVSDYCWERGNQVDPEKFLAYYESNGWKVGRNPMKSWKAAITTWEKGSNNGANGKHPAEFKSAQDKREDRLHAALATLKRPGGRDPGPDHQDVSILPERPAIPGGFGL